MAKALPEHKDKIGQAIEIGSIVAYPISGTRIGVGSITKLHPVMITVKDISGRGWPPDVKRRSDQVVAINGIPETLMYLLTKSNE